MLGIDSSTITPHPCPIPAQQGYYAAPNSGAEYQLESTGIKCMAVKDELQKNCQGSRDERMACQLADRSWINDSRSLSSLPTAFGVAQWTQV